MNVRSILLSAVLVAGTATITAGFVSQDHAGHQHQDADHPQAEGLSEEMMAKWMKIASPGEHHQHLNALVGKWQQEVKWWMYPGAEPSVSSSTSEYEWILGGRFLCGKYEGLMMGEAFQGLDIVGYDNFRGEYRSLWIDSMTTQFMLARGQYDPETRTINMKGKHDDFMAGIRDMPFRTEMKIVDGDHLVYQMYAPGPDGNEFLSLQVSSTRIK